MKVISKNLLLMLLFSLFTCSQQEVTRPHHVDVFEQVPASYVDILWVVDNSPSMTEEQDEIAQNFSRFIGELNETNIDFHIAIVTTDMEDPDYKGKFIEDEVTGLKVITYETENYEEIFYRMVHVGANGSPWEMGLEAARFALSEMMLSSYNTGFLRDESILSIIIVSDENDCSDKYGNLKWDDNGAECYSHPERLTDVVEYIDDFRAIKEDDEDVIVSAIVAVELQPTGEACAFATYGARYIHVVEEMHGVLGDICHPDFSDIMVQLGLATSGLKTSFELTHIPEVDTIRVYLDEVEVFEDTTETNGWSYNETDNRVYFWGDCVPPRGSTITIEYDVASWR